MSYLNHLFIWFFPPRYTQKELAHIPLAPDPQKRNIFALYDYHHKQGKELVYTIKKQEDRFLLQYIAKNMTDFLREYLAEQAQYSFFLNPIVIPVPLTKQQLKKRGFNQSARLARYLAQYISGEYHDQLVFKNRETKKQALIHHRVERFNNVRDCFSISTNYSLHHRDIIIVDDLVTTGATISEIEKTLRSAGARNVIGITIAH